MKKILCQIKSFIGCRYISKYRFLLLTSSILFILFFICEISLARAGGGGGYSGGGGFSGGSFSGGGSSSGGGGLFFLIYFCIRYPYIGIPAVIIFGFLIYSGSSSARSGYVTKTIRNGYINQMQNDLAETVNKIKSRDENFSIEALTNRIKTGFIKIQNAWAEQNIKSVRYLMSDGIFERFSIQLGIQNNSKIINKMDNIEFIMAQIVAAETEDYFDTIHVMVTASASDYYINSETNKPVYGSQNSETFTEYWSFLRRPGAKTRLENGLLEGNCPNCGNALNISDSAVCPSCSAIVNSGEYDWVLAEITQPAEWKIKPSVNIPGIEEMMAKDPAFNIQHIEDKTSVMFYRNIAAAFYSDSKYISKLALKSFTKTHISEYQKDNKGRSSFYADAAIGCVEVMEIKLGGDRDHDHEKDNDKDRIRVKVKWAGHPEKAVIPSFIPPAFEQNRIYTQEYILVRNTDVKASVKNILSSTHCPNCGAPETLTTLNQCEYCGAVLNDGSRDWVLEEITYFKGYTQHASPYQALQHSTSMVGDKKALNNFDNETIIACSAAVMLVDENIDEKEYKLLKQMASNRGISLEKLNSIIESVREYGLHIPNPKNKEEAHEFLRCMIRMCLADGKIMSQEKQLIKQLVSKMNYTDIDINLMIKRETAELYKAAKRINKA